MNCNVFDVVEEKVNVEVTEKGNQTFENENGSISAAKGGTEQSYRGLYAQ